MFYRRDIFEKAGLPTDPAEVAKLLSTWESYIETGKKVNDPKNNVFWMDNASQIPYIYYAHKTSSMKTTTLPSTIPGHFSSPECPGGS